MPNKKMICILAALTLPCLVHAAPEKVVANCIGQDDELTVAVTQNVATLKYSMQVTQGEAWGAQIKGVRVRMDAYAGTPRARPFIAKKSNSVVLTIRTTHAPVPNGVRAIGEGTIAVMLPQRTMQAEGLVCSLY